MTILAVGPVASVQQAHTALGGDVVHAAQSYLRATGNAPTVLAVVSDTPDQAVTTDALKREFSDVQTVVNTQTSDKAIGFSLTNFDWLLIASLDDGQGVELDDLLDSSIASNRYWLPTERQAQSLDEFLQIAKQVSVVQINAQQASNLTGEPDVVLAICKLRVLGINSIVVVAGELGVFAYLDGEWGYCPSFQVKAACGSNCGAILAGTLIASMQKRNGRSEALRLAAAAAALRFQTGRCGGTPAELEHFAATTPMRKFSQASRGLRKPRWRRRAWKLA